MKLAHVSAMECFGCLPDPVVSCGTAVCCIVHVGVGVEVTEVMDELQRLLGGGTVGHEHGRHEDKAVGVASAELLLSVLQVVTPRVGDGDIKYHVGAHVWEVTDDVPCFRGRW